MRAEQSPSNSDVVVVGAGPAGIATALALKDAGVRPVVLDKADRVASSWHRRYDRLQLNTWRGFSHLPKRKFPKGTPTFPTRDQVIKHIEHHAGEDGIDLRLGTTVERIDRTGSEWMVRTDDGDLKTSQVVLATGYAQEPTIPDWTGRETFAGQLIHSAEYRNPRPFEGERVLVVGPGCSGMEIARDLAEGGAAEVWLSVRTAPNIVNRQAPGPIPAGDVIASALMHMPTRFADAFARFGRRKDFGDLSDHGLPVPDEGVFSKLRRLGTTPTIIDEEVVEAIREGQIEVVSGVEALDQTGVELADGSRLEPDAVICATGYRRVLEPIIGHLNVLDERQTPLARGGQAAAEGLRFVGFVPRPGALGYMGKEGRCAAAAISRELRSRRGEGRSTAGRGADSTRQVPA